MKLYNDKSNQIENESLFSKEDIKQFLNSDLDLQENSINKEISPNNKTNPWNILIVDDDKDIHRMTELSLDNFNLNKRTINFHHAYSAKEAEEVLAKESNIALIFLDVVMETSSAGLDLVKHIREKQENELVQIVLNTGQPGYAPEREVIKKYKINFYQAKADFTESRLFIVTASSLRAYESLKEIKDYNENLEFKIYERTKELELALHTKDKLFSVIGHDLRNPFNTILGYSNLLQEHVKNLDKKEIIKFAAIIDASTKQVNELLTGLLDWARAQSKKLTANTEKIEINKLITSTIKLFKNELQTKSNNLKFNPNGAIYVNGDINLINTVVRNLISNAQKYTERGIISISIEQKDKQCKIFIKDTGIGIEQSKLEKLLTLRQNTSTIGTRKEKGTGLGLIICKEFVELNSGKLFVESEFGKGSTFSFTLPLFVGES